MDAITKKISIKTINPFANKIVKEFNEMITDEMHLITG